MHLARFPRVHLAHLPTPLEKMDRLSKELGGPEIWIKRDDCTGLSTGGNKTRKLEFLMAEALAIRWVQAGMAKRLALLGLRAVSAPRPTSI